MASNKMITLGPVALTTATNTDIFSPPSLTGGTGMASGAPTTCYFIIRHVRVVNKTATAAFFALWKGASGTTTAGKEVIAGGTQTANALDANRGVSVAANSYFDWYGAMRLSGDETDKVIVGGASAATTLTIQAEAEFGIV